jgi:flagellar assembly protein FliH
MAIIPKEKLTAYQRWELASFDAGGVSPEVLRAEQEHIQALARERDEARIQGRQEGEKSGYAAGYAAGYNAGLAQGEQDGAAKGFEQASNALNREIALVHSVAEQIQTVLVAIDEVFPQKLGQTAWELARCIVGEALAICPETVLEAVHVALNHEPAPSGTVRLLVHPDDMTLILEHVGDELTRLGWLIRTDNTLDRGGCRLVAQSGDIDATLKTRWHRLMDRLKLPVDFVKKAEERVNESSV